MAAPCWTCAGPGLRYLCSLLLPCFLWQMLPGAEDLYLFVTFFLSEVVLYSLRHVHGLLFLVALFLILWTKRIIRRWHGKQILQAEFFRKLCYLMLTSAVTLLAVFFVWVPLYDAYANMARRLEPRMSETAMRWRSMFFVVLGSCLFSLALSRSDLIPRRPAKPCSQPRDNQAGAKAGLGRVLSNMAAASWAQLGHLCSLLLPHFRFRGSSARRLVPRDVGPMVDIDPAKATVVLQEVAGQMPTTPGRHTLVIESVVPPACSPRRPRPRRSADFSVIHSRNLIPERRAPTTRSQTRVFMAEARGSGSKVRVLRQTASLHCGGCKCPKARARRP